MIAGSLTYRVELLQPVYDENAFGEGTVTYRHSVTARAERVTMTGRQINEVGEHFAALSAQFRVRSAHKVEEHWRLRVVGTGELFAITAVIPNFRRGFFTLICERVNE